MCKQIYLKIPIGLHRFGVMQVTFLCVVYVDCGTIKIPGAQQTPDTHWNEKTAKQGFEKCISHYFYQFFCSVVFYQCLNDKNYTYFAKP